jgi:hypothetical protein
MDDVLAAKLALMWEELRIAAIRAGCKDTALWCIGRLPALYDQFQQTSESRYGEQLTGHLQGLLNALARSTRASPEAQQLAASVPDRLQRLHEAFGLPQLGLKSPVAKPLPSRKSRPALPRSRSAG